MPVSESQRRLAAIKLHQPDKLRKKGAFKGMSYSELHKMATKPKGKKLKYKVKK